MDIADFSLDLFSLAGRHALVTGGNTGLGRAFSLALAKAGADVFAVGLAQDDGTTRALIEDTGRRLEFEVADITQPGVPAAIVRHCVDTLGSLDILVNCAGIALLADVEDFGRGQWDPMVAVNLTAAFEFAYEASKVMIGQRSGKIINIASLFSFLGGQRSPAYAATKAGLAGFTKAYCDELAVLQHPGQRHRARLLQDGYHRGDPRRSRRRPADRGAHPRRPLGGDRGPDGGHRLPGQPGLRLR